MRRAQRGLSFDDEAPQPVRVDRPVNWYPIPYGSAEYHTYWSWHGRGMRDEPQPNETLIGDDDPALAYARLLGWKHGRQIRPIPKEKQW